MNIFLFFVIYDRVGRKGVSNFNSLSSALLFVFPGPVPLESTSVHPVANAGISLSTAQSVQLP